MSTKQQTQTPTPDQTPQSGRPAPLSRNDSEVSTTSIMEDAESGYESQNRSRSQSRRRRRQNQRQKAQGQAQAGNAKAESMAAIAEQPEQQQQEQRPQLNNPATADTTEMQPFERIKPPSQSMNGPVTYARAMRGEIPMRGKPPSQPYETTQGVDAAPPGQSDMMEQDGLKLRIELNLDIEIELKASIHGDLTLALLA